MKLIALAALLAGFPAQEMSQDDRVAVATSLLGELAGDQHIPHRRPAGRRICVVRELTEMPLAGQRQPGPGDMKFDAPMGQPRLPWKPDTEKEARDRLWWVDPELPAERQKEQQLIQDAALLASEKPENSEPPKPIDQKWLTSNQVLGKTDCPETITLSEPNIALDYAFIEVSIECGFLCGLNALYVMRRQDGHWSIVDGHIYSIS